MIVSMMPIEDVDIVDIEILEKIFFVSFSCVDCKPLKSVKLVMTLVMLSHIVVVLMCEVSALYATISIIFDLLTLMNDGDQIIIVTGKD